MITSTPRSQEDDTTGPAGAVCAAPQASHQVCVTRTQAFSVIVPLSTMHSSTSWSKLALRGVEMILILTVGKAEQLITV
jgi:hypothetical protein